MGLLTRARRWRDGAGIDRAVITTPPEGAPRPTAGALRLVEIRSENPASVDMSVYVEEMYEHCPFLQASTARGMTGWTVYEVTAGFDRYAVEAELFLAAVHAAERVRLLAKRHGALACENIVVLAGAPDPDQRHLMGWPHWALKHLYAPVGIMFGKFAQGVQESDRSGRNIPPAPFSFLSVRASVRGLDPIFLKNTPDLSTALAGADDDGRDVFEKIPCDWKTVREWASSLPAPRKP
ncbi:hypothetical protein ACFCXP_10945 [Streptomyces niveus]|uniref:hypothetical protein n=1 Tax=Streptomyces niveus TaxID=193462 RepID=UPI0035DEF7EA